MRLELRFFAGLRGYLPCPAEPCLVEVPPESTVGEVLARYGVPEDKPRILLVNGRHALLETALAEGDVLSVFPPVAGG